MRRGGEPIEAGYDPHRRAVQISSQSVNEAMYIVSSLKGRES